MAILKRTVCLANSRKIDGRCIAAKELTGSAYGGWIRPVSDRETEELNLRERCYEDGTDPQVLDIIDMPLTEPKPTAYQAENWLIDSSQHWTLRGRATVDSLDPLLDSPASLWELGSNSGHGYNDRVPKQHADGLPESLYMLRLPSLELNVHDEPTRYGSRRRIQARFVYNAQTYWMSVTDPIYERRYGQIEPCHLTLNDCCVTISLTEPYELTGYCYKLVAAIIERE